VCNKILPTLQLILLLNLTHLETINSNEEDYIICFEKCCGGNMLLTSNEIKLLSKSIKKTFTFSRIAELLKPIIKSETLANLLNKAIGEKSKDFIKNGASLELTKNILGATDINEAIARAKKDEGMTKHQIIDGVESILKILKKDDTSYSYNRALEQAIENYSDSETLTLIHSLKEECLSDFKTPPETALNLLEKLSCAYSSNLKNIEIDSYQEPSTNQFELSYILEFSNDIVINLDLEFTTDVSTGQIDQIDSYKSSINDVKLEKLPINLDDLIIQIINYNFDVKIKKENNKSLTNEQMKKLSLFLSNI
jgi:hypothetical protein